MKSLRPDDPRKIYEKGRCRKKRVKTKTKQALGPRKFRRALVAATLLQTLQQRREEQQQQPVAPAAGEYLEGDAQIDALV